MRSGPCDARAVARAGAGAAYARRESAFTQSGHRHPGTERPFHSPSVNRGSHSTGSFWPIAAGLGLSGCPLEAREAPPSFPSMSDVLTHGYFNSQCCKLHLGGWLAAALFGTSASDEGHPRRSDHRRTATAQDRGNARRHKVARGMSFFSVPDRPGRRPRSKASHELTGTDGKARVGRAVGPASRTAFLEGMRRQGLRGDPPGVGFRRKVAHALGGATARAASAGGPPTKPASASAPA